jgi:UMF1 family MFS transporter
LEKLHNRKQVWSWAFYDWANSSFTTIILTFVYGAFFVQAIAPDPIKGAAWWSYALAASGLALAVLGPLCGAIADHLGYLKRWIAVTMVMCLAGTLVMWLGVPGAATGTIFLVLGALMIANIGFELSIVFNNALLPHVASPTQIGKVSSLAWGIGYFGGLVSLVVVLFGLIGLGEGSPWLELPRDNSQHVRACVLVVAAWYFIFSLPFFFFVKDKVGAPLKWQEAIRRSVISLKSGFAAIIRDRTWRNFLIGSALYRDGLATLFALGGVYAASRYNLEMADVLLFGIAINVTAGIGCVLASFLEDRFGSLKIVRWSLLGLTVLGIGVLLAPDKAMFFVAAILLGFFVGPVQSASRTLVARLSPENEVTERYGFYALTGRAVAFMGPLCFGLATDIFNSQQAGMATILLFWVIGFMLVRNLRDPS